LTDLRHQEDDLLAEEVSALKAARELIAERKHLMAQQAGLIAALLDIERALRRLEVAEHLQARTCDGLRMRRRSLQLRLPDLKREGLP
jgi:hypothetical protein